MVLAKNLGKLIQTLRACTYIGNPSYVMWALLGLSWGKRVKGLLKNVSPVADHLLSAEPIQPLFPTPHSPSGVKLNQSNLWNVPYCFKSTLCYIQSKGKRQDSSSLYRLKKKKWNWTIWSKINILTLTLIYLSHMWTYKWNLTSGFKPCIE